MRKSFLMVAFCLLAVGVIYADVTVNFPSNNTFYCSATDGCGFMGANGGLSAPMWTTGDFVTETFFTGQLLVNDLTANWGVVDDYGGNPGAFYENDVYINGVLVALFDLPDCNYCKTLLTVTGTINFAPIVGNGTYNLSIVLAQTAPGGDGSEWFSVLTTNGGASTTALSSVPEPGSMVLLGSGVLGFAGLLRRKLLR
jgi:hypothetical protein